MRRLLSLALGLFVLCTQLFAQSHVVKGRVLDETGSPVQGASVQARGTREGTSTNALGEFTLTVSNNTKTLIVSGVGFSEQEIALGNQSTITINLKAESRNMEQVVVTGYTREKRTQFVGSATVLSSKIVENVPVGAFDQALQGRAPGLLVNSGSGQPGASANLTIRGISSITGQGQPLFVLDGIPLPSGSMQTLNPDDFESITILKDASAAALYGARGSLGVIVLTSKKGRSGSTSIQYRTQFGFTQAPNATNFDMMNTSEILQYEERLKIGGTPGWNYSAANPAYATLPATSPANNPYAASQARYNFILDSIRNINTDIASIFFRQGTSKSHELNISGGSDKTRFYISGSYFDQQGTDIRSHLKRYTTRFNIEHTADKVTIQFNTTAGYSRTDYTEGEWYGNSTRNTFQMSWRAKPYENPYKADGSLNYGSSTSLNLKQIANAVEGIDNSTWYQNQIKINSGLNVAYKLIPSLTIANRFGIDYAGDVWQRWINPASYIGSLQTFNNGSIGESYKNTSQIVNTTSAIFSRRINNIHELEVGAYFEVVRAFQRAIGYQLYNLDPRTPQTGQNAGTAAQGFNPSASSAKGGYGIRSYFGTLRYTYNDKYTVNANYRRDGTSIIVNPANKEISTYSFGLIWNAIKEDFIKNQNVLTDLKLRASYGSLPSISSIPRGTSYPIPGSLVSVTNYQGAQLPSYGSTTYAGSSIVGLAPTGPANPDLTLEYITKLNIGTDFAVWNNRARFMVDVYNNQTHELYAQQPLPGEAGFGVAAGLSINAGRMSNKGVEFMASVDVIKTKNVDLTLNANHAINKNRIEDLGLVNEYATGTFLIKVGLPYGSHYTYHYMGADPATGRPVYETKDGGLTDNLALAGQFAKFGTYVPKHTGGFGADLRFGHVYVSAFFSYQFDVVRSNNIENWITRGIAGYQSAVNGSERLLTQQWMQPGDVKYYQNPAYDRDFTSSDLEDAKFLRFRNLNVAYEIPQINIAGRKLIKGARFYVEGQNIFVWSTWRGPDPEDNNNISLNEFPNPRAVVAGVDVNF
ncbi:MAG: SusC/RagA family TonB-linked outer membrane protein [Flavisolibacter sp.]